MSQRLKCFVALMALASQAHTQTIVEIEPNETKSLASANGTILVGPGVTLTGSTMGSSTSPGSDSIDYFEISVFPLKDPQCYVCKHTLTFTTQGPGGHVVTLRGLEQVGGVITPNSDREVQLGTSSGSSASVTWYATWSSGTIYVSVAGTSATTSPYTATVSSEAAAFVTLAATVGAGPIRFSTVGLTDVDTEIQLYDSSLHPIPGAHNDDAAIPVGTTQSTLERTLTPNWYVLSIAPSNMCTTLGDGNPDENDTDDPVLDFTNVAVTSAAQPMAADLDFSITDATITRTYSSPGITNFGIRYYWFQVVTPEQVHVPYCFGDGSGSACPCGNHSTPAEQAGCTSSLGLGARLFTYGTARIFSDSLILSGSRMPDSSCLYFQGTTQAGAPSGAGTAFGDGKRCAGGDVLRIGTKVNSSGASFYPWFGEPPVSSRGMVRSPGSRTYQIWYRNSADFCTASTFNLTNGVRINWFL